MVAYCLFCETVKCEELAERIRREFGWMAINPRIVQRKWVKGRTYVYGILGDASLLDLDYLRTLGPVKQVTLEDIFGY